MNADSQRNGRKGGENLLGPKRRFKTVLLPGPEEHLPVAGEAANSSPTKRIRMKRSGRVHQKWTPPGVGFSVAIDPVPVAPTIYQLAAVAVRACRHPLRAYSSR